MKTTRQLQKKKEIFHFRTDQNLATEVKQLAEESGITTSDLCRDAVAFYLSTGIGRVWAEQSSGF